MCLVDDASAVVCARKDRRILLRQLTLDVGKELQEVAIAEKPSGMAVVQLGGTNAVVLSYRSACVFGMLLSILSDIPEERRKRRSLQYDGLSSMNRSFSLH